MTIIIPDYKTIEYLKYLALDILEENRIRKPPVIAAHLARKYNLEVMCAEFDPDSVAGFIDEDSNAIVVNYADPPEQQNFTIAHELGHFLLDHHKKEGYSVLLRHTISVTKTREEREADWFADHLLVPAAFLREYVGRYPFVTNQQLANMFGVSESMIQRRKLYEGIH